MESNQSPHIAILPSPGMGHLIPLAEFAKRLVLHHNFSVTIVALSIDACTKSQKAVLDSLPRAVNPVILPPIPSSKFPDNSSVEAQIGLAIHHSLPSLGDIFKTSLATNRVVALVVDVFGTAAFDVAREYHVEPYMFNLTSLMCLSFCLHLPKLHATHSCEFRHLTEPVRLPGCMPVHGKDVPDPVQNRSSDSYALCLHTGIRMKEATGIFVNSFEDLEPGVAKALREDPSNPPIYAIGPLIQTSSTAGGPRAECLRWLDEQPRGSVLFVSFGSGGTLSQDQLTELAWGLEMSGHRFMWVLRGPHDKMANAAFLDAHGSQDPLDFLPEGFGARTRGLGLVVPSWAPQLHVLSHVSTGGFVSHCGWNSTLESFVNGVPMIAWPLYAEQRMNAVMLVEDLKVALRPRAGQTGLVTREEIARVIKCLMEGEEGKSLKKRMHEIKEAAHTSSKEDGSSHRAMGEVARAWNNLNLRVLSFH